MVCPTCGIVTQKEVVNERRSKALVAIDLTRQRLGSYMGPPELATSPGPARAFPGSQSTVRYMKLVSDFTGREDSQLYACAKLTERVCEKLSLPNITMREAVELSKRVLGAGARDSRVTLAAVSAYCVIAACKIEGLTSVSVKDVVEVYRGLGRRVKASSIIQLSLDSPVRTRARRAEDYVPRVLAKLAAGGLFERHFREEKASLSAYLNLLRETSRIVLEAVPESEKAGHSPTSLAATSVYAAESVLSEREGRGMRMSQRDVSRCGDAAEYTVREQFREIFMPALFRSGL